MTKRILIERPVRNEGIRLKWVHKGTERDSKFALRRECEWAVVWIEVYFEFACRKVAAPKLSALVPSGTTRSIIERLFVRNKGQQWSDRDETNLGGKKIPPVIVAGFRFPLVGGKKCSMAAQRRRRGKFEMTAMLCHTLNLNRWNSLRFRENLLTPRDSHWFKFRELQKHTLKKQTKAW